MAANPRTRATAPTIKPRGKPKLDLSVQGQTGLPVWAGRVYEEMLRELEGDHGRKVFREMSEQDPVIGGIMLGIEMIARQVTWSLKPADDSPKAKEVAEFIDGALSDMHPTFGGTMSEVFSMLVYGWSWLEVIYKKRQGLDINDPMKNSLFDDDKIGWAGWAIRGQESFYQWEYDNSLEKGYGYVTAMMQNPPPNYPMLRIPRSKSLHFKTRSRRQNPEGVSLLRNAYRPWYMKNNIEVIEGIGVERDLAGLPVLWAPENLFSTDADQEEKALFAQLQKIVTSIKRDEQEGILMPQAFDEAGNPLYKLELLSTGGDRQFDTSAIISRYDERIAMSMLADFILMGHGTSGSFALSSTKTGLFSTAMSAILDIVAEEVNAAGIPKLVVLNGWTLDMVPTLEHGPVEAADMGKLGDFLKALSGAGMTLFPNPTLEKFLLEQAGLPGAGEVEEVGELPLDPITGLPIDPTPIDPNAPQLTPEQQKAARPSEPTPPQRVRPPREVARRQETQRAASESKHFTPLPVRVKKIRPRLFNDMEREDFDRLMADVMSIGKFSKLKPEYQEAILEAEAEEAVQATDQ